MTGTESWGARWGRRCVSVPLYLLLAGLGWGAAPLWAGLAALADLLTGHLRFPLVRAALLFLLYLGAEVAGVAAATAMGLTRDPVVLRRRSAALQRWWTGLLFDGVRRIYGMRVEVEGADVVSPTPFLLFVRHSSTADTVLAAALVANPRQILLRYVLKRELLWDPCLDLVGQRLPNTFVDRSGQRRDAEIVAVAALAEDLGAGEAVLVYPEGTRFSEAKLARAKEALQAHPLGALAARFTAVLPPRVGGPLALLDAAPTLDVVFLEHAGFEGAATMPSLLRGALIGRTLHVRLRRVPRAVIPATGRDRWLFEEWLQTDAWVHAR